MHDGAVLVWQTGGVGPVPESDVEVVFTVLLDILHVYGDILVPVPSANRVENIENTQTRLACYVRV